MKKAISFVLAALMLVSAVPTALATNDYTQGTQVVYTATGSESYTITVPASLNPGQSGTVTLDGYWPDSKTVTVTAEKTVTLKNSIKAADTKTLNVTFLGISEAGSNTSKQTFTEPVSVEGISNALFGTWSGKFNYNVSWQEGVSSFTYTIDGVGEVDVVAPPEMSFNLNKDANIITGIDSSDEEVSPSEIPNAIPELITFTTGSFESNATTVEYETTVVETKVPKCGNGTFVYWLYDENGNIIAPLKAELSKLDINSGQYIVYNENTGKTVTMEGQTANALVFYMPKSLDNAIYTAAYMNKLEGTSNNHIAQWNGACYEAVDYSAEIAAVTDFTQTRVVIETKTVVPEGVGEYTFTPTGTGTALPGMTWAEWIVSDYNTTGLTADEMTIRDINHNEVDTSTAIQDGASYSLYEEVPTERVAGLYKAGTDFGELIYTWDEMVENDMVWASDGRLVISVDSNEHESVDLIISDTITTLGCQCFDSATSLETVVVPSSVTYMEDFVFWGIDTVILQAINPTMYCNTFGDGYNVITTDIYYAGSEAQWNAIQVECYCLGDSCEYGGLYIPENATIHYNYIFE